MKSYAGGIRHDYKELTPETRAFDPRVLPWFAAGLILPLAGVLLLIGNEETSSAETAGTPGLPDLPVVAALDLLPVAVLPDDGRRVELALPLPARGLDSDRQRPDELQQDALLEKGEPLTLIVKRNDSLDGLFRRNDLSVGDLDEMVDLPDAGRHLGRIRPGDEIKIIRDGRSVLSLRKELTESQELWIHRNEGGYKAEFIDLELEFRTAGASGVIASSLWLAANEAGLGSHVIGELSGIFQWDIDFFLDVRQGDTFTVIYEEIWRDGRKLRDGEIVAAEYVNRGESYRAARYIDDAGVTGYYTPEGMSVKRPFLRNPIEFTRVSSNFNPNRRHPILNTIRAHRGVDLAAPSGTEIRAAGAGKIVALGANGSFGNRVEIQHGGNITTLYAHLSKFGSYRTGDRVDQGDIIGYVGMTGGATGPHLHYEYRLNGVHQNPRTVALPDAQPIAARFRDDFETKAGSLFAQLERYRSPLLAQLND